MKNSSPREALQDLYSILHIDQGLRGPDHLKALIAGLAKGLNVKYAFTGHTIGPERQRIQTDIVWAVDNFKDNFIYELSKTPCEKVFTGTKVCVHKENVAYLYPEDKLLAEMGVESYIGVPILNRNGELSGIFVLLDDKPMRDEHYIASIVELLAIRFDTEMEHCNSENKPREIVLNRTSGLENSTRKLYEANKTKEKSVTSGKAGGLFL